jgi:hypothetical protein
VRKLIRTAISRQRVVEIPLVLINLGLVAAILIQIFHH